jgi:hypothetical protein
MQISLRLRRTNDYNSSTDALKVRVLASLGPEVLPIARSRKFQRKANDCKARLLGAPLRRGRGLGKALLKALECTDIEKAISKRRVLS